MFKVNHKYAEEIGVVNYLKELYRNKENFLKWMKKIKKRPACAQEHIDDLRRIKRDSECEEVKSLAEENLQLLRPACFKCSRQQSRNSKCVLCSDDAYSVYDRINIRELIENLGKERVLSSMTIKERKSYLEDLKDINDEYREKFNEMSKKGSIKVSLFAERTNEIEQVRKEYGVTRVAYKF